MRSFNLGDNLHLVYQFFRICASVREIFEAVHLNGRLATRHTNQNVTDISHCERIYHGFGSVVEIGSQDERSVHRNVNLLTACDTIVAV